MKKELAVSGVHEAAKRYAAFDRSDPFAYRRAMSHFHNGVCNPGYDANSKASATFCPYNAQEVQEKRKLPDGQTFSDGSREYTVTTYNKAERP